jgi:hypothetical protein
MILRKAATSVRRHQHHALATVPTRSSGQGMRPSGPAADLGLAAEQAGDGPADADAARYAYLGDKDADGNVRGTKQFRQRFWTSFEVLDDMGYGPADANRDQHVDFGDLAVLAQHYGQQSRAVFAEGDFDYDGGVNFADLVLPGTGRSSAAATSGDAIVASATPPSPPDSLPAPLLPPRRRPILTSKPIARRDGPAHASRR